MTSPFVRLCELQGIVPRVCPLGFTPCRAASVFQWLSGCVTLQLKQMLFFFFLSTKRIMADAKNAAFSTQTAGTFADEMETADLSC